MARQPYLTAPENNRTPRLFVAATRQNDGKTTTCLGLFSALQQQFSRVGYIKPMGQRFVHYQNHLIDEDSLLFDKTYDIQTPIESMSPVAIDSTFTRRYLEDPETMYPMLVDKVLRAFDRSAYEKDIIIIEGSGHAGVGSICNLSNAEVARLVGAKAIIVARGGIGQPVDEIALNKSLFDRHGVEVVGAILNKVDPSKKDVIRRYTQKALERMGVPLLGIIPTAASLSFPNMAQVVETVEGRWLNAQSSGQHNRILNVVVGAMTAKSLIDYIKPGVLVITPGDRDDVLLLTIAACSVTGHQPLAGIVLTSNILPSPHIMEMIAQTNIPVVISHDESYTVASRINSMTVKTQPEDEDKIPLIKKLILENVDIETLIKSLRLPS
ncbi:MAG TPA: AAA family ATPase [Oceanipulchritudo sp.]|nr:AAA family ATPase [Oceanipulchritudo sp.]